MSSSHHDRMSSVPLMNLHERRNHSNNSPNVEQDWSDQEIEEFSRDPLESVLMQMRLWPQAITRQQCVQSSCFFSAIALCVGFLFAYIMFLSFCPPSLSCNFIEVHDKHIEEKLQQTIDSEYLIYYLKNLTEKSQPSSSRPLYEYIVKEWRKNDIEDVKIHSYSVLLSYPNEQNPNKITISGQLKPIITIPSSVNTNHSTIDFTPYSATGQREGKLVYLNYGEDKDYEELKKSEIDIEGAILLVRFGPTQPSVIIENAESNGAAGILFYPDPKDEIIHTHSIGSTSSILGDPLTPNFPSKDYAYREDRNDANLPKILVQPITSDDARVLFGLLEGPSAREEWKGNLNVSYRLQTNKPIQMYVNNKESKTVLHNVIGVIKGKLEPDRYVLIGSHRNERGVSTVDSLSGTAALLELTRAFSKLKKNNWQPRRTIVFCSWADDDAIGSTEWTEEFGIILANRAVVYLNLDILVQGFGSLHAISVPSLYQLLFDVTRKIPLAKQQEKKSKRKAVSDILVNKVDQNLVHISLPAAKSDYASFIHILGIPVIDVCYMSSEEHSNHSHSDHVHLPTDENLKRYQEKIVRIVAELVRTLADSPILPFNVTQFANFIRNSSVDLKTKKAEYQNAALLVDHFEMAVNNLTLSARHFETTLNKFDKTNPFSLRAINDKMMQLEKAFINPLGLSCSNFKHSLYATNSSFMSRTVFPCLHKAFESSNPTNIHREFAEIIFNIETATNILQSNPL